MPQLQEAPVHAGMPHQHTDSAGHFPVQGKQDSRGRADAVPEQSHVTVLLHCLRPCQPVRGPLHSEQKGGSHPLLQHRALYFRRLP